MARVGVVLRILAVVLTLQTSALAAKTKKALPRIFHTPVPEQTILTPIPIWVESSDASVARVVVKYRVFGSKDWATVDLAKASNGYGGEISCRDVGTITGTLRYYVTALDAAGNEIGAQGSLKRPFKIKIRSAIKSPPPHLPGRSPPAHCGDTSDCPPGFPGCLAKVTNEGTCTADDDCDEGMMCNERKCGPPPEKPKKNWIPVGGLEDILLFNDANFCTASSQARGDFSCLRQSDGARYHGAPLPGSLSTFCMGRRPRGCSSAIIDSSVTSRSRVRGGYVVPGLAPELDNRKRSLPVLAEARIAYWFSVTATVRPMLFLRGVRALRRQVPRVRARRHDGLLGQIQSESQTLDVGSTFGPWFAGGGAGVMFATSNATGFVLEVQAARTFPVMSTVVSPALSFAIGF